MAKNVEKLLAQAQKAYQKNDKKKGALLIDQILQKDYFHPKAWMLLHQFYAPKLPLEQFQRNFTENYYPEKLPLLQSRGQPGTVSKPESLTELQLAAATKKPSFFSRLFRTFRRTSEEKPSTQDQRFQPQKAGSVPTSLPPSASSAQKQTGRDSQPATPSSPGMPASTAQAAASDQELSSLTSPSSLSTTSSTLKENRLRVLVVDDIPQTRAIVIRALRFQEAFEVVGTATNGQQGIQMAIELEPDVIVMDVNMPGIDGIAATGMIKRELPTTEIIIMTVQDDVDYMRRAMAAGARDFLAKPPELNELIAAVKRAGALAMENKAALHPGGRLGAENTPINGKVITVYSPRGGVGCTTLAVNLAATLHSQETPVVVVDGNLQFGDVPVFFNTQCRYTIVDIAPHAEELNPQILSEVLTQHASGIHLLSPPRPEQAEIVNSWQFIQLIKYLRRLYSYIIIDTTHRLSDITLAALDICDVAIVIATQDIPALARLRQFLDLAPALELDKSNTIIVINAYTKSIGITSEKIEQVLKRKIITTIPMDKAAAIPAMNRGIPFMLNQEALSRPIANAIQELKDSIIQRLEELEKKAQEEAAETKTAVSV